MLPTSSGDCLAFVCILCMWLQCMWACVPRTVLLFINIIAQPLLRRAETTRPPLLFCHRELGLINHWVELSHSLHFFFFSLAASVLPLCLAPLAFLFSSFLVKISHSNKAFGTLGLWFFFMTLSLHLNHWYLGIFLVSIPIKGYVHPTMKIQSLSTHPPSQMKFLSTKHFLEPCSKTASVHSL